MEIPFWRRFSRTPKVGMASGTPSVGARLSHRAFLKTLIIGVGSALASPVARPPRSAQAAYIPGISSDTVDTNLTVQGNLMVSPTGSGSIAIGTTTQQGKLNVNGDIWVNGMQLVGADGIAKQSYYAP